MNTKIILEVFVEDENKQHRILAVQRFESGESPEAICISLGKSKAWLYKWVGRHLETMRLGMKPAQDDLSLLQRTRRQIS